MSDLDKLAADLLAEATTTVAEVRAVVSKGALNIKKDWRARSWGIAHAPRYPLSITYDLHGPFEAEIGPHDDAKNQGFLGPVLEFGGAHNAPRNDGGQALAAEEPRFRAAIEALAGKHLLR